MLEQTFSFEDLPKVATLTFLEILLSADNAIVLGVLSHSLPEPLRRRALYIGVASSFVLRGATLLAAAYVLRSVWFQLAGSFYLLYLAFIHFWKAKRSPSTPPLFSFWKTVVLIELFDLAFAIDSIVAGVAFIGPSTARFHPKLWIVYLGGMLGLLGVRYAAGLFSSLIDRFRGLESSAYLMIGWIGLELALDALHFAIPYQKQIFWFGIAFLFSLGFIRKK